MDATFLVEDLRRRGIEVQVLNGRVRCRPKHAVRPDDRDALVRFKSEVIAILSSKDAEPVQKTSTMPTCLVCGERKWIRSSPGGGVFCGGCSSPEDIGLNEGQCRPANDEELRGIAERYEYFRMRAEQGDPDESIAPPERMPDSLPYRCCSCGRDVTLALEKPGMYWYKCTCRNGFGRVAAEHYESLVAYDNMGKQCGALSKHENSDFA